MIKHLIFIIVLLCVFAFSLPCFAVLIDRGAGLIYDDVQNLTWLQDANYAHTTGYDIAVYGYDTNGGLTHDDAMMWADALVYLDSRTGVVYDDWRLPKTFHEVGGWHDGSEMGKLYYLGLNNVAQDLSSNMGPFINVQAYWYRSSNVVVGEPIMDWAFCFKDIPSSTGFNESGYQATADRRVPEAFAWAVRDGDIVQPVPEPTTVLLFGLGGLAFSLFRRKR